MGKGHATTPDVPRIEQGVTLFRSCLVGAEYPGVESSTKWLFERFGIEYTVNPTQTCCTGLGYYSDLLEVRAQLGLGALFPPEAVVKEVQTIFEATGFKERLAAVRGEGGASGAEG